MIKLASLELAPSGCHGFSASRRIQHTGGTTPKFRRRRNIAHGVCRQWNEAGRLLGKYRMVHGTGVQRTWHENGRLQLEFSTVNGDFSGRYRLWLNDGKLMSEDIFCTASLSPPRNTAPPAQKTNHCPS